VLTYEIDKSECDGGRVVVAWSISNSVGNADSRKNEPRKTGKLNGLMMTALPAADDPMKDLCARGTFFGWCDYRVAASVAWRKHMESWAATLLG